jgi:hypothetical protein
MAMIEKVLVNVSDITQKHFVTLHMSDIQTKEYKNYKFSFEFSCFCQDILCTIFTFIWIGQVSLEDVMCSIYGISVEMCAVCENSIYFFSLVL